MLDDSPHIKWRAKMHIRRAWCSHQGKPAQTRRIDASTFLSPRSTMAEPVLEDELLRDRARVFEEFLSDYRDHNYGEDITTMLSRDKTRLVVNVDDVRKYNREFADGSAQRSGLMKCN